MIWILVLLTTKLIPRSLTPGINHSGIRSLTGLGNAVAPRIQSVLYLLKETPEAAPKGISGRTSYLRVRLAFHPYPQLIQAIFN